MSVMTVMLSGRTEMSTARSTVERKFSEGVTPLDSEPGLRGAHEKGEAVGQVGHFRRNDVTPGPRVNSLDEPSARLQALLGQELSKVASLNARRSVRLLTDQCPLPSVDRWDPLLKHAP
ncbi:hypothetical protein [Streptomyces zhihengii]|uniref:Transposase n=1 Tax=Streptomyces zhihengii TaxID=1818004 RepID=A0ABS2V415_9ACTN|nr:hypothetical protein [Streptomyces zhihengii]MBM9624577.1 hypothetical protein [Streptomyces zhihengii]